MIIRIALLFWMILGSTALLFGQKTKALICDTAQLDQFDVQTIIRTVDEVTDTLLNKIPKFYRAFRPCRTLRYQAIYKTAQGALISDEIIEITPNGQRTDFAPQMQHEIVIKYFHQNYSQEEKQKIASYNLNASLPIKWESEVAEGIIENEKKVWMHPLRHNQYIFTEVAPFPDVNLPLEKGKKWQSTLNIFPNAWGDWGGTILKDSYKVQAQESRTFAFGELSGCWRIKATSKSKLGKSQLLYWYHPEYGFVEKQYTNYQKETLHIKLIEIVNP